MPLPHHLSTGRRITLVHAAVAPHCGKGGTGAWLCFQAVHQGYEGAAAMPHTGESTAMRQACGIWRAWQPFEAPAKGEWIYKHVQASTLAHQHSLPKGGHTASPRALKTWREIPFRNCPDFILGIQTTSLVIPGDLIHTF